MKRKIRKAYEIAYPKAIALKAGAHVAILREETNPAWLGWLFCRSEDMQEGWIFKDYINRTGDAGVMNRAYDAKEVAVGEGELVEVLREEHGWAWVKKADGDEGWIPLENFAD